MAESDFFRGLPIGGWLTAPSAVLWLQLGTSNYRPTDLGIVTCPPERIGEYRIGADNFSQSLLRFSFRRRSVRKFVRVMSFHEAAVGAFDPFHGSFLRYAQGVVMRSHDQVSRVVCVVSTHQGRRCFRRRDLYQTRLQLIRLSGPKYFSLGSGSTIGTEFECSFTDASDLSS